MSLKLCSAVLALSVLPFHAAGRDGWFLSLGREGAGSVYVSAGDKTAYIIDGGFQGQGGIQGAEQIRSGVLEALRRDHGIENLVITVTHPHADHAGGLRQMVTTDPWMMSFQKVTFVEGDQQAPNALGKLFEGSSPALARAAAAREIPIALADKPTTISAAGKNAYEGIAGPRANVVVESFAYQPVPGADANGRSIIHVVRLIDRDPSGREVASKVVIDTADADNAAIGAFTVQWASRTPPAKPPTQTILSMPHHGSKTTNSEGLLAAVKPTNIVFTVNDQNRYGHPHPDVLRACLRAVDASRVHFTGSTSHLHVPDRGKLESASQAEQLFNYATFIRPAAIRALYNAKGDDVEPVRSTCTAIAAAFYGAPARRPSDDLWPGPVAALDPLAHGPSVPGYDPMHWSEGTSRSWYKQLRTIVQELNGQSPPWNGVEPLKAARDRRFAASIVGRPRQGGMVLGNRVSSDAVKPAAASLRYDRSGVLLCVEVVDRAGKRMLVETDAFPESVLWSALEFIEPRDEYVRGAIPGVSLAGEVSVFGGTMTTSPTWGLARFEAWAHPALAGTPLAFQSMRLDSSVASLDRAGGVLPPADVQALNTLRLRDPSKRFWAYQFFDGPSLIRAERGRLWVQPADGSQRLLKMRVWVGADENDAGEDVPVPERIFSTVATHIDALADFDAFARMVAVARWLSEAGVPVHGRERLHPAWIPLDSTLYEFEVAPRLNPGAARTVKTDPSPAVNP